MNNSFQNTSLMCYMCDLLEHYVNYKNTMTPRQGSLAWLEGRKCSIGCSELYKACGSKSAQDDLIRTKTGRGNNLTHILAILHGNIYESSTKKVTELLLGTKIYNMSGSIRHPNGVVSCSPDGIGIVKLPPDVAVRLITKQLNRYYTVPKKQGRLKFKCDKLIEPALEVKPHLGRPSEYDLEYIGYQEIVRSRWAPPGDDTTDVKLVALFEFKSRHGKEPVHNKIQPDHLFQVLGGIEVMNIAYNVGVYAESSFDYLQNKRVTVIDSHRNQQAYIYFGSCKYVKLVNETFTEMSELDLRLLKGKRVVEDYNIIDGPYMFSYDDVVTFDDNGFFELYPEVASVPIPTETIQLNVYFDQVNKILGKQKVRPDLYKTFELTQMSIKYVSGLKGFIDLITPQCKEVLDKVSDYFQDRS